MKALVLNARGRGFDVEDVEIASPGGREVLVDVQASGLCHTDFLFATHDIVPTPSVLGHEVAGIVAAISPDVTQIHVGDRVVGSLAQACGGCARCLSGRSFQCQLQGRMNLDDLVSRTISLREVNDGYESLKSGSLNRVVVASF
jgi:S-(hydroxymethyl)glutathione dehydrogenase/alcohol dehydrogenase